jgi:hypothetical protein
MKNDILLNLRREIYYMTMNSSYRDLFFWDLLGFIKKSLYSLR